LNDQETADVEKKLKELKQEHAKNQFLKIPFQILPMGYGKVLVLLQIEVEPSGPGCRSKYLQKAIQSINKGTFQVNGKNFKEEFNSWWN
jgi:hypothetical protein